MTNQIIAPVTVPVTYEIKNIEKIWVMGVLHTVAKARNGKNWVRIDQKSSVYNFGKFETGANLEFRNLQTAEHYNGYHAWITDLENQTEITLNCPIPA